MSDQITVAIRDEKLSRLINRFAVYRNKTVPEIVRAQARLVAVNLAHNTQPYGSDDAARFKGTNAVRNDLGRVFIGATRVFQIVQNAPENKVSQWLGRAVEDQNIEDIKKAWLILSGREIAASRHVVPSWHKDQRNRRGRVKRTAKPMIVTMQSSIDSYSRKKEKLVGFGKSGWAAAAKLLGGTRGIPGWVSRNKGPGGATDKTRGQTNTPHVILHNRVTYVSMILPDSEIRKAINLQKDKMILAIEHGITAEKKAAGF